jgi:acyl-coenzyme A thioesterase PaaI-like protein
LIDSFVGCAAYSLVPAGVGYTAIETKANFSRQIISAKARLFGPCVMMPPHGATTVLAVVRDE